MKTRKHWLKCIEIFYNEMKKIILIKGEKIKKVGSEKVANSRKKYIRRRKINKRRQIFLKEMWHILEGGKFKI